MLSSALALLLAVPVSIGIAIYLTNYAPPRLARFFGGIVDSHTSLTHGPSKIGAQLVGKVTCTLGEVKNRADLLIYWGTNPVETHPRHLTKYTFTPKGRYVPRGRHDRRMFVVDVRETPSARVADRFLQVRPGVDFELLTVLRALVNDQLFERTSPIWSRR